MPATLQNHVYLAVIGFGDDPSVVTAIMGIEPTMAWIRGQARAKSPGKGKHTHSRWTLQSRLPLDAEVEPHLDDLLGQLEPLASNIDQVQRRFEVHIGVATYGGHSGFMLNPSLVRRIAALNVAIDVQMYGS